MGGCQIKASGSIRAKLKLERGWRGFRWSDYTLKLSGFRRFIISFHFSNAIFMLSKEKLLFGQIAQKLLIFERQSVQGEG